jgi:hypothetical protein
MAHHPGFPSRPLLRPGVRVCRRSDGEVQVGLDRALAVVAPDTAEVRAVLEGLHHGVPPARPGSLSPAAARLCAELLDRQLVVDADIWLAALGSGASDLVRAGLTATVADAGTAAARVLERRSRVGVLVDADGLLDVEERFTELLRAAAVHTGDDLVVLLRGTEPDRSEVDALVRRDVPHVFLVAVDGTLRLGPFVQPGRTACLRCVDAHHTERDPRRALVVQQYAEHPEPRDGLPEPLHADLLQLALGYLARDVTNWVDGRRPATWSATVRVDPTLALPLTPWPRHPGCGCSWAPALAG